jgi:phosphopantetheine adenylyltransferase
MQPFKERLENVELFLKSFNPLLVYDLVPIVDPFGPSIVDKNLSVLVVSKETESTGLLVNQKRIENGLNALEIRTVDLIMAKESEKQSSTAIRQFLEQKQLDEPK